MKKNIILTLLLASQSLFALETDQFLASKAKILDSSEIMNHYFRKYINKSLDIGNAQNLSCEEIAFMVLDKATGKFTLSAASTYASSYPYIDRFPKDNVNESEYRKLSFYENAWLPLQVVPLARTININGIYVGTDKFGHFSHQGKIYYHRYLQYRAEGMSDLEAQKKTIIKGFSTEYGILGYGIDGALSYGDLEANYQGLMFGLDMCRGENPILIKDNEKWIENPKHLFTVRDYFTPKMDESYNVSFWRKPLFNRIETKLKTEFCENKKSDEFQERVKYYKTIEKNNLSDELIAEVVTTQDRFDFNKEQIDGECRE